MSGSPPAASGPFSSIAARSSRSRPRRATRATSPQTTGDHERSPAWSPDGKSIAYFSDATGEYQLVVRPQDGKGEGRSYPLKGSGFYEEPSLVARQQEDRLHRQLPDPVLDRPGHGHRQADRRRADLRPEPDLADQVRLVARLEVAGLLAHQPRRVPVDPALFDRFGQVAPPDRRPGRGRRAGLRPRRQVPLFPRLDRRRPRQQLVRPVQSPTCRRPARSTWSRSPRRPPTRSRRRATRKVSRSPARTPRIRVQDSGLQGEESDGSGRTEGSDPRSPDLKRRPRKTAEKAGEKDKPVAIDLDGIAGRVVALPVESGHIQDLAAGADGQVYYIRRAGGQAGAGSGLAREALAEAVRPQDPRGGDARRGDRRFPGLGRPQEDPLPGRRADPAGRSPVVVWGSSTRASSTRVTVRSSSRRSRCGSTRGRNGRRSCTKPGGSTAITSMRPTCTGPTGTPCGGSTRSSSPTWRPATT